MIYGYSPREIAFGVPHGRTHVRLDEVIHNLPEEDDPQERMLHRDSVEFARMHLSHADQARSHTYQERTKVREALRRARKDTEMEVPFEKGDLVLRWRQKRKKADPSWDGPYRIFEQTAPNTYRIMSLAGDIKTATYNASKLRLAYSYYGSPIRTAAKYTKVFSDKERQYYIETLEDVARGTPNASDTAG